MMSYFIDPQLKTEAIIITGESLARALAAALISQSCWFMTEPMPDDEWELTVKTEALPHVLSALARIRHAMSVNALD